MHWAKSLHFLLAAFLSAWTSAHAQQQMPNGSWKYSNSVRTSCPKYPNGPSQYDQKLLYFQNERAPIGPANQSDTYCGAAQKHADTLNAEWANVPDYAYQMPATLASCSPEEGYVIASFDQDRRTNLTGPWKIISLFCVDVPREAPKPKIVMLDPGHGYSCASMNEKVGAVGSRDFRSYEPPPGRMREDDLTVAFAKATFEALVPKYAAMMTKTDANTCLTLKDRGRIANNEKADVFISIHADRPLPVIAPMLDGSLGIYNEGRPGNATLATLLAEYVSISLGVNNRGTKIDNGLGVLKPTTIGMPSALIETARLSGTDEMILHASTAPGRVAAGIRAALDAFFR